MDPKLQAMMARRAAMMDDIDDDACYREDANVRKATGAALTEVRGGRDITRAYKMAASGIAATPPRQASVADVDMDELEPEPIIGVLPQQEWAPRPELAAMSMSDFSSSDNTEHAAKPTPRQGELPAQPSRMLDRQLQQTSESPSQRQTSPSVHSGGRGSISDVSSPLSHSLATLSSHSHSRAATNVSLSAEEALLQFTANSRCMNLQQRILNVRSETGIRVPAAEQEESFSTLAMRAETEWAEHEASRAEAAHRAITTRKLHHTDLGKNLSARVCTVTRQKVSENNAKTQCHVSLCAYAIQTCLMVIAGELHPLRERKRDLFRILYIHTHTWPDSALFFVCTVLCVCVCVCLSVCVCVKAQGPSAKKLVPLKVV